MWCHKSVKVFNRLSIRFDGLSRSISGKILPLLVLVLLAGLAVGCTADQPVGWSGSVVADGTLFLGTAEGKLAAIDASEGAMLRPPVALGNGGGGGFGCAASSVAAMYGTPVVSQGLVYLASYNGRVYAFQADSGEESWRYPSDENRRLKYLAGGVAVAQDRVYLGSSSGWVYALDAVSGVERWKYETGGKLWTTPATSGDTLYIGSFDKKLYALAATDGTPRWEPFETGGAIVATPAVADNAIYFGSFDRHFYAVNATDGSLKWRSAIEAGSWFWARALVHNGRVYAPCLDGKVYVLSAESGEEVTAAINLESPITSSPVLLDNTMIIATEAGEVYSLDTGTNQVNLLADLEEEIRASLCGGDGVVYVHTQDEDKLYALDAETGVRLWSLPLSSE